jgi:RNA polymerase sigma-70 factor (ECF subfamily)
LLNQQDAEDVSQEVFIEIFKSISQFNEASAMSTWIYRIAVTKSLDELKKRKRKKRWGSLKRVLGLNTNDDRQHSIEIEGNIEAKEQLEILYQLMDKLPENQRIAFTLSKMNAFSNSEVAEIMNTSIDAAESLIYRAKRTLTRQLEEFYKKDEK